MYKHNGGNAGIRAHETTIANYASLKQFQSRVSHFDHASGYGFKSFELYLK